jgi:hypothetical protein
MTESAAVGIILLLHIPHERAGDELVLSLLEHIREAVLKGKLKEPFTWRDVKRVSPGCADKTYKLVLVHNRKGNPIKHPECFARVGREHFRLIKR